MSKFIERLKRVSEGEAAPLGFGIKAPEKMPQMVLGAILTRDDIGMAAAAVEKGIDAVLISLLSVAGGTNELGQIIQLAAHIPWGVWLESPTAEEVKQVREMGCDFLLFDGERTSFTLLREEGLGKIMKVESALSDSLIRTTDRLPVDALFMDNGTLGLPLSVNQLMDYYRFVLLTRKPLLVSMPSSMSDLDVEMLWEVGIAGVFLKAEADLFESRLSALQQAIKKLPSSRRRPRSASEVSLPYLGEPPSAPGRSR
jgi:hypothetical protein